MYRLARPPRPAPVRYTRCSNDGKGRNQRRAIHPAPPLAYSCWPCFIIRIFGPVRVDLVLFRLEICICPIAHPATAAKEYIREKPVFWNGQPFDAKSKANWCEIKKMAEHSGRGSNLSHNGASAAGQQSGRPIRAASKTSWRKIYKMAERQGFEPWRRFLAYTLSRRAPSTTRPPLRIFYGKSCLALLPCQKVFQTAEICCPFNFPSLFSLPVFTADTA